MDRPCITIMPVWSRRPHARGDGPSSYSSAKGQDWQAPRTWGWTADRHRSRRVAAAGPTHVGMDRARTAELASASRRPHARGDGPYTGSLSAGLHRQAPRTWGWTGQERRNWHRLHAGPTHVGMDRPTIPWVWGGGGRPHARGDGPYTRSLSPRFHRQAPRTWGWTGTLLVTNRKLPAGPTHVGMDRFIGAHVMRITRRPHARGDGPVRIRSQSRDEVQAPRTWGWTGQSALLPSGGAAGPTHVGMDRRSSSANKEDTGRPHARGDGPVGRRRARRRTPQAPRTWGWTGWQRGLFWLMIAGPTHVGMDRREVSD